VLAPALGIGSTAGTTTLPFAAFALMLVGTAEAGPKTPFD